MTEENIITQDYSSLARVQIRYFGEQAAIRHGDPKRIDQMDLDRIQETMDDPRVKKYVPNAAGSSRETNLPWYNQFANDYYVFLVSGAEGVVGFDEVGEYQGYVSIYSGYLEQELLFKMIEDGLLPRKYLGTKPFQVSFGKYPQAKTGQIASGLRQVCHETGRIERERIAKEDIPQEESTRTIIMAVVDPTNIGSMNVLSEAGFTQVDISKSSSLEFSNHFQIWILDWDHLLTISSQLVNTQQDAQSLMGIFQK